MAGRTTRTTRRTSPSAGGQAARRTGATKTSRGSAAASRRSTTSRKSKATPARATARPRRYRGLLAVWMWLARGVGWLVRAIGRQAATAKEIEPEYRRDGAGLLVIAVAVLLAMAVWFDAAGPVGGFVAMVARRLIGAVATLVPLLLLILAVRLMRAPAANANRGRAIVGWTALLISVTGLLDLMWRPEDLTAREWAGGLVGGLGGLIAKAVTAWVAVPTKIGRAHV